MYKNLESPAQTVFQQTNKTNKGLTECHIINEAH